MTITRRILIGTMLLAGPNAEVLVAQTTAPPRDLAHASLEELMNIEITSVSRTEQRAVDVAAAIFVITQDDIRRSGISTLPELFRLVPGMQVSQINSNNWAVSVRGLGSLFTNKLLVLVDGRSIYNRSFSGVFWSSQDLLLDDIERIEIVRGPGGSIWGANAVNGVINIITKPASETPGALVRGEAGTFDRGQVAVRYGGSLGMTSYRVYTQWSDHGGSATDGGGTADDAWTSVTAGFRVDRTTGRDLITAEGSLLTSDAQSLWRSLRTPTPGPPSTEGTAVTHNATLLARWIRTLSPGTGLQVQSFVDRHRLDNTAATEFETVVDIDVQYQTRFHASHALIAGGGYRDAGFKTLGSFGYSMIPSTSRNRILNAFLQDEVALGDRVRLTLGSKFERDTISGWSIQPTARLLGHLTPRTQQVWVAASRAIRTPSAQNLDVLVRFASLPSSSGPPIVLGAIGNPRYEPESFVDIEAGYRLELGTHTAIDVTAYRGRYEGLQTAEPVAAVFEPTPAPAHVFVATQFNNLLDADSRGLEVAGHWTPFRTWRFDGSYSAFRLTPHLRPTSQDLAMASYDGDAPGAQWQLHSSVQIGARSDVTAGLFHVAALRGLKVPAYTRADARIAFKLTPQLALIGTGQNLSDPSHREYAIGRLSPATPTLVPRSGSLHLVWRF